jgi:hypothetical protein
VHPRTPNVAGDAFSDQYVRTVGKQGRAGTEGRRSVRDEAVFAYATFAEAVRAHDAVAVLFGDYGGDVYLTAPMHLVKCTEDQLVTLHSDLDAITWMGGNAFGAAIAYERHEIPSHLSTGGGEVISGVWVHPGLGPEVAALAREVVLGQRERLPRDVLTDRRAASLANRKQRRQKPETAHWLTEQGLNWDYDVEQPVVPFPER